MTTATPPFLRPYLAFAAGYLLSYLFRMGNAVIAPDLLSEMALSPGSLGLLTGAYLAAFAALQIPLGMLLDRYGPRRVEPALLVLAGVGALAFASASGLVGLVAARALIGAGCAAGLMAPLKAIAVWYPPERQSSLSGWIMAAGGCGALLATWPLEAALTVTTWRGVFVALALFAFAIAAAIWLLVPDVKSRPHQTGLAAQWHGVLSVFAHPRLWWIAPVAALGIGAFFAIQGLWSVPWLIEVEGLTRATAARYLFVMAAVMLAGYFAVGLFAARLARRGIHARHLFAAGYAINLLALVAIVIRVPGGNVWWAAYGLGATVNVLAFAVMNDGLAPEFAGRSNTVFNLLMFGGSFAMQWGVGVVVDIAKAALGYDTAAGLRLAFAIIIVIYVAAFGWFAYGWRRNARVQRG
jgi:predicted MFS family arabinose efflux permease